MILADGYIPLHIKLLTAIDDKKIFKEAVEELKALVKNFKGRSGPESLEEIISAFENLSFHPGAHISGAVSSNLNVLRMVRALTGEKCTMAGVLGSGPIESAIRTDLSRDGINLQVKVIEDADSSVEISLKGKDYQLSHEMQLHFMRRGQRSSRLNMEGTFIPQGFIMSRPNNSRRALAESVLKQGGEVSQRLGIDRYSTVDNNLAVTPLCSSLLVKWKELRALARALGIAIPRGKKLNEYSEEVKQIAEIMGDFGDRKRLVAITFPDSVFTYAPGLKPVRAKLSETICHTVPVSRFHGALFASILKNAIPKSQNDLENLTSFSLQAAVNGYQSFPAVYPGADYEPKGSWCLNL